MIKEVIFAGPSASLFPEYSEDDSRQLLVLSHQASPHTNIRDWSLIMGRGGYKTGGGGHVKFYPYEKGGGGVAEKVLAILKGGHKKFWGSFYAVA